MRYRILTMAALTTISLASQSFALGEFILVNPSISALGGDAFRLRFDVKWSGPILYYDSQSGAILPTTNFSNATATPAGLATLDCTKLGRSQFNEIPFIAPHPSSGYIVSSHPGDWTSGYNDHSMWNNSLGSYNSFGYDFMYDGPSVKSFGLDYSALLYWGIDPWHQVAEYHGGEVGVNVVPEPPTIAMMLIGILGGILFVWRRVTRGSIAVVTK